MATSLFITAIGTDAGKTVVSPIFVKALRADYWKPVQSGDLASTDSDMVVKLANPVVVHAEAYRLTQPLSPHAAAARDGIQISLEAIRLPKTDNCLIIEGAGGLMVPLNDEYLMIDLIQRLAIPAVLVSRHYLGSINHTLLSLEALKSRGIPLAGIVFNGSANPESESIILKRSGVRCLGRIEAEEKVDIQMIQRYAEVFRPALTALT